MSSTKAFRSFSESFSDGLKDRLDLDLGAWAAHVLSGENPSLPSAEAAFVKKLIKRRRKGKPIKERDIDALLDMVETRMQYQALSGKDRVGFARQVVQKIIPSLTATDLENVSTQEVANIPVTDEFRESMVTLINDQI